MSDMLQTTLLVILLVAVLGNAVLRVIEDRRYSREMEQLRKDTAVLAKDNAALRRMLHVLADTWGDPPADVKAKLRTAIEDPEKA